MKRFATFIAVTFMFCIMSFAENPLTNAVDSLHTDVKEVVSTVYSDGKNALSTIYPDVKSAIVSIGKAIGVAAEHVYGVLVKKYFVLGLKEAGICLIGITIFILGLFQWNKVTKNQAVTYRIVLPFVLMLIGLITIVRVDYDAMLMGLINPEYGAINYILEYTKEIID